MQTSSELLARADVGDAPAFTDRWNGWGIVLLALVCLALFIVIQSVLGIVLLIQSHPEIMQIILRKGQMTPELARQLKDPAFIITFLNAKNLWILSVVSESALALATAGLAYTVFGATWRKLGIGIRPGPNDVLNGVFMGIVLLIASSIVGLLITVVFGPHPQPQALALVKHHGAIDFVLDFMSVSVAAPIAEELFFRGFLFTGLVQRMAPGLAIFISAFIFGLAHLEKWSFLPIFVIGLGLAWIYYRTRTLWANITAHATVNTISLILAYVAPNLVK